MIRPMSLFGLFLSPREKILKRVRRMFGAQATDALRELDRYSEDHHERYRVQRAILALTKAGSLEDLKRWVQVAISDYREVITLVEYPNSDMGRQLRAALDAPKPDPATTAETSFADLN